MKLVCVTHAKSLRVLELYSLWEGSQTSLLLIADRCEKLRKLQLRVSRAVSGHTMVHVIKRIVRSPDWRRGRDSLEITVAEARFDGLLQLDVLLSESEYSHVKYLFELSKLGLYGQLGGY